MPWADVQLIVAIVTRSRGRLHHRALALPTSALGEEQRDARDEQRQVSLRVQSNKPRKSLIRKKAGSWVEKETEKRGKKREQKKPLIISRLLLDKHGGKCHSIQQPPRAAACLDRAVPEFLLITAWEIFGGGVCLCLLEINSSPVGRQWEGNAIAHQQSTLVSVQRPGSWGRRRQGSSVLGTLPLGQRCGPCHTGGSPSLHAPSQC